MSTPKNSDYLLLFRGTQWDKGMAPEEIQELLGQFMSWLARLNQQGICKGASPLATTGKVVSGKGRNIADGPYSEAKEAVGGYFLVQAESLDAATVIAQQCPLLAYGVIVEVRPVAQQCPTSQRLDESLSCVVA